MMLNLTLYWLLIAGYNRYSVVIIYKFDFPMRKNKVTLVSFKKSYGVIVVNVLNCDIAVSEFELHSCYHGHLYEPVLLHIDFLTVC